jgi:hypothetical protein
VPPVQHATVPAEQMAATTGASDASEEIVREAEQLAARLHPNIAYQEPSRNPFRFTQRVRPATAQPRASEPEIFDEPLTEAPQMPSLRVSLTGIAEDTIGGATVRTAVLSTPDDVLLVKEGEMVAGQYKVTAITGTSVELTRVSDGSVVRLVIRP